MLLAFAVALIAQAVAPPPATAAPAAPAKQRVLVLDLRNDGATPEHARLVTDNIVVALSRFSQLEVVSSEDVRRIVQTEGERQSLGCADDSCLTEIASAMGASLVVHGSIGKLESITVVNLHLYDSKAGKSIGREAIQVQRLDDLPYRVDDATARLVRPLLGAAPATTGSPASPSPSSSAVPPTEAPKANRVLAGGVAGGVSCCVGASLFAVTALIASGTVCGTGGVGCLLCTVGGAAVGVAGGVAPLVGGLVGGAPVKSTLLPAVIGLGVGAITAFAAGTVVAFSVPIRNPAAPADYFTPGLIAALPVGLLTGAAAAIATGLLIDDPAAAEPTAAASPERQLPEAAARYAMAY